MDIANEWYEETVDYIKARIQDVPETVIVLGSGLGMFTDEIENKVVINYKDIPHFPVSTVAGHAGELIFGMINYTNVLVMSGRFHYYEGYDINQVTFPIRVFAKLGIKNLILTNAAGGINLEYSPGELMLLKDHINFTGVSPLRGKNLDDFGTRFPDMSDLYSEKIRDIIKKSCDEIGISLREGVYAYMQGPNYETPSEIRALRVLGADAVGMSTVPEAIVAKHSGLRVVAVSCITNMAAGVSNTKLSHIEVKEVAEFASRKFINLIKIIIKILYNDNHNASKEGEKYLDGDVQ